jgi:short-subunit dehydrogenase
LTHSLKKISEQVIVITGASSGIGLATALMAAERGAKVILSARSENDLRDAVCQIRQKGGEAVYVEADVSSLEDVDRIAERALSEFGRIDSWINNAGISIFGKLTEVPMEEKRRLFEVNFWGIVYGCRAAVKAMSKSGGAIINVGSTLSDRAIPIQGMYSATKHAVKAYTDVLRMELEADKVPISVSLVKPGSINTPFTEHAQNHQSAVPTLPAPIYDPTVAAKAILNCCETSQRDVYVGGSAKFYSLMEKFVPRFTDFLMEKILMDQSGPKQVRKQSEELFSEGEISAAKVDGESPHHVMKLSLYTSAVQNPGKSAAVAAGLGVAAFAAYKALQNARKPGEATH